MVATPSQTLWPWPEADRRRKVDALRAARETALPGTTVNLLHPGFANYAHFMLQLVPRLACVRRVVDLKDLDQVLVPDSAPKYVLEVLARVGVETDQMYPVPADPPQVYVCERLVTATMLDTSEVGPQWAADAVRIPYAAELATRGNRRLYLAREAEFSRRILNEGAVVSALEARGFESVSMTGLTVAEQAALIAGAECIVGLHGAALANWVFAHPGTRVVELLPANLVHSMYERLAGRVGLQYRVAVGTEPCAPGRLRRFLIDSDTTVDVAALTRLLDAALVS